MGPPEGGPSSIGDPTLKSGRSNETILHDARGGVNTAAGKKDQSEIAASWEFMYRLQDRTTHSADCHFCFLFLTREMPRRHDTLKTQGDSSGLRWLYRTHPRVLACQSRESRLLLGHRLLRRACRHVPTRSVALC